MNEILLYGPIGADFWEPENSITAKSVMAQLNEIDGDVTVRISSGGGDVYEGIDIMNALKNHDGEVTVIVESLAASAASFIAVGGADRVLMRDSSEMMIHRAWTWAEGNADEVRRTLSDLERQDAKLANIYAAKAGGPVDEWLDRMSKETWYAADEAVAAGLADGLIGAPTPAQARKVPSFSASRKRFKYSGRVSAPPPPTVGSRSESAPEPTTTPSNGQEGETMSFLNKLAQAMGMKPEDVRAELSGFLNEQTAEVPAVITVSYPDEATVVPTGRTTVEPTSEVPEGLTFSVTGTSEGWTGEVNETTGVVTVVSADGSRIGDAGEVTLKVTGSGGEAEFTLKVTVVSADDKAGESTEGEPLAEPAPLVEPGPDNVVVPRAFYDELTQAYAVNGERLAELAKRDREAEVDGWIAKGKFSAGLRTKALAALEKDPDGARRVWGALPDGRISRAEKGYSKAEVQDAGEPATKEDKIAAAMARANQLAQGK